METQNAQISLFTAKITAITPIDLISAYSESMDKMTEIIHDIGYIRSVNTRAKRRAMNCKYWCFLSRERSTRLKEICERLLAGHEVESKEISSLRKSAALRFGKGTKLISPDTGETYCSRQHKQETNTSKEAIHEQEGR